MDQNPSVALNVCLLAPLRRPNPLATPGITAPLLYRITSLPLNGVLRDSANVAITDVPYTLPSFQVSYSPAKGFLGFDSFSFEARLLNSGAAMEDITLLLGHHC